MFSEKAKKERSERKKRFGRYMAEKRKESGMKTKKIAQFSGVSTQSIYQMEWGRGLSDINFLIKLCDLYRISLSQTFALLYPDFYKLLSTEIVIDLKNRINNANTTTTHGS